MMVNFTAGAPAQAISGDYCSGDPIGLDQGAYVFLPLMRMM